MELFTFTESKDHNVLPFLVLVVAVWFIIFWLGIAAIVIFDSGWFIFGAIVTWIVTGIVAGVLIANGEEICESIADEIKNSNKKPKASVP